MRLEDELGQGGTQLPPGGAFTMVFPDIAARDQAVADGAIQEHQPVLVEDASADPNVDSGGAYYIFRGGQFYKLAETESTDIVHTWDAIIGRPASTPGAIDAAVGAAHVHGQALADIDQAAQWRHQHQDSDADIHDAVAKRHAHAQPLADIDQAAQWRHQHQDSDADIHDAVAKRHSHGQPLANIDEAAQWRHQHQDTDADIHDAVTKRHEHANKPVLDLLSRGGHVDRHLIFDSRPLVIGADGNLYITVAPDQASRQSTDVVSVGWDGILEAIKLASWYAPKAGSMIYVQLRPGIYDGRGRSPLRAPAGHPVTFRPTDGAVTLPDVSSYVWNDRAADEATLRAAYSVRLEFDSWTCFYAQFGEGAQFENILFENVHQSAQRRATYVAHQAWVKLNRCSTIKCMAAIEATGTSMGYADYGGHHFPWTDSGYLVRCFYGSNINVHGSGTGRDRVIVAYGAHAIYVDQHGGVTLGGGSNSTPVVFRNMKYDMASVNFSSRAYLYRVDVKGCRYGAYAAHNSGIRMWGVKFRDLQYQPVYGFGGTNHYIASLDVDNAAPEPQRRVWMRVNSSCYTAGGHTGTLSYNPPIGQTGNGSSNIRGNA